MQLESPCTCFAVRRLARRVTQLYDQHLAGLGIRTTQYSLLSHVRARPGRPMGELALRMGMDRSTLTRNLRPLVDAGLAATERAQDRRTVSVSLTEKGRRLLADARVQWRRAQDDLECRLGVDKVQRLHRAVEQASGRLEFDGDEAARGPGDRP
jgi:DNA-binding MarR family transcriptional regulator